MTAPLVIYQPRRSGVGHSDRQPRHELARRAAIGNDRWTRDAKLHGPKTPGVVVMSSTILDIAAAEKVSDRFVSRMMRLAYLSPEVLEYLVIRRVPPALSLYDLADVAARPWAEQMGIVFDRSGRQTWSRSIP